jgi:hypothetical protein
MMSRTKQLMTELRHTSWFRDLVPVEASMSWPVPFLGDNNTIYVTFMLFGTAAMQSRQRQEGVSQTNVESKAYVTALFPPFAGVTVNWLNGQLVDYTHYRFRSKWKTVNFDQPIGIFPHPEVAEMPRALYLAMRDQLCFFYDRLLDDLYLGVEPPSQWVNDVQCVLNLMIEPALKSFYKELAPQFYAEFMVESNSSRLERPKTKPPEGSLDASSCDGH